ncbi:helicase [Bradyrhizobium sp. HKCCYLRH3099]|uniref:helicase n=1 Tax=unclassified Bradyrhizobium TaxID=2631580 RepID=UPI003EB77FFC
MNAIHRMEMMTEPLQTLLGHLAETVAHDAPTIERLPDRSLTAGRRQIIHQHELEGLPGVTFNTFDADGPVWLSIECLAATEPPVVADDLVRWIDVSSDPERRPLVRQRVTITVQAAEKERLIADGDARAEHCTPAAGHEDGVGLWSVRLCLEQRADLVQRLEHYLGGPWAAWAGAERPRRRTIAIYQTLRELARADGAAGQQRGCEIVWGIGVTRWRRHGHELELPLLERLVTIEVLDRADAEIRIRPRLAAATAHLKPFEALSPATKLAAHAAEQMLERGAELSPFQPATFEPILSAIGSQLDPQGIYCPTLPDSALVLPEESEQLVVSDRWVLFARPRSDLLLLRDIERLRRAIDYTPGAECCLGRMAQLLLGGPDHDGHDGPRLRLSGVIGERIDIAPETQVATDRGDLFFPLPTNSDEMEIVRQLRRSDGVIVRGASGPDRRSAIANVVCHHLALGLRVLIVSRHDMALSLLATTLPRPIRDLTLDLTGSDADVLKRAEGVISRLQSIIDVTGLRDQAEQVNQLEQSIISTSHAISRLDDEIADIASRTLLRSGTNAPSFEDLATLVSDRDAYAWFTDRPLGYLGESDLLVAAVEQARAARLRLGDDLAFVDDPLPDVSALPDTATLVRLHRGLQPVAASMPVDGDKDELARRVVNALEPDGAERFADDLDALAGAHRVVAGEPWLAALSPLGAQPDIPPTSAILVDFARDASSLLTRRSSFLVRPVETPTDAFASDPLLAVIERLASGQSAVATFSLSGRALKRTLDDIKVSGFRPKSAADWAHIRDYLLWRRHLHSLDVRWRSLADEIGAPTPEQDGSNTLHVHERVVRQVEVAIVMAELAKRNVRTAAAKLSMPDDAIAGLLADASRLTALAAAIRSAVARAAQQRHELARLTELFDGGGSINAQVQADILSQLGRADIELRDMETRWTAIRARLQRLHDRRQDLELIREVCESVTEAGAGALARRIRTEPARRDHSDPVLVADWTMAWNWAVLMRQTEGVGQHQRLHDLSGQRALLETRLRELFEQVVVARMQLHLAQNTGGAVRQSFDVFLTTLRKLGTSCSGPNAGRMRQVAREALETCHDGIPCHLLPAWRVAEQLPARLGAFDLVVVDDASQSDLRDLTVLLRGRKVLAVADELEREETDAPARVDVGGIAPAGLGGLPLSLRQLMPANAKLCDLLERLFPNRVIRLREHARRIDPLAMSMAGPSQPFAPPQAPPTMSDVAAVSADASEDQLSAALEDEIASVAESLSLARQERHAEPPLPAEASPPPWLRSRADAAKIDRDIHASHGPHAIDDRVVETAPAFADVATTPIARATPASEATTPVNADPAHLHAIIASAQRRRPLDAGAPMRRPYRSRAIAAAAVIAVALAGGSIYWQPASSRIASSWGSVSSQLASWTATSSTTAAPASTEPRKVTAERMTTGAASMAGRETAGLPDNLPSHAVLYQEDSQDPLGKRYLGKVTWRVEPAAGSVPTSIKGDIEIDKRMKATLSLRPNTENDMPASHIMELKFNWPDDPAHAGVDTLKGVSMKMKEAGRGAALATLTAKVTPEFFMIALSAGEVDAKRNVLLLKGKEWIDIPIVYNGGSRAVLAIEKGADGDRAFKDAFSAWGQ